MHKSLKHGALFPVCLAVSIPTVPKEADSGWPRVLRRFAAEAWRRADAGELDDEALYPSDAAWAGLYDRMPTHEPEEKERRLALAADYGDEIAD